MNPMTKGLVVTLMGAALAVGFVTGRVVELFTIVLMFVLIYIGMYLVKKGKTIKIRTLPAIEAIPEAVGRAAEMGRPIYFSGGQFAEITTNNAGQTMAAMAILSYTAGFCAKHNVELFSTVVRPEVVPIFEDVMGTAYNVAGHPEKKVDVRFLGTAHGYLYGTLGMIERERVAATILVGAFSGDVIAFAEVGNRVGALQIGGTARYTMLPSFVVSVDYCLLGEELFAAQAMISKVPIQLGTIWCEDWMKFGFVALTLIGVVITSIMGYKWPI